MPCRRWDNFAPAGQKLSFLDKNGNLVEGDYKIYYDCYWRNADLQSISGTNVIKTITFKVIAGCPLWLDNSRLTIAEYLLLSTPAFISAECDNNDQTKETIFRKLDVDMDGRLSQIELTSAVATNQVDTGYLSVIGGELSLGDVAKARVRSSLCTDPQPQYITYVPLVRYRIEKQPPLHLLHALVCKRVLRRFFPAFVLKNSCKQSVLLQHNHKGDVSNPGDPGEWSLYDRKLWSFLELDKVCRSG